MVPVALQVQPFSFCLLNTRPRPAERKSVLGCMFFEANETVFLHRELGLNVGDDAAAAKVPLSRADLRWEEPLSESSLNGGMSTPAWSRDAAQHVLLAEYTLAPLLSQGRVLALFFAADLLLGSLRNRAAG
jgi:hypothetical protein